MDMAVKCEVHLAVTQEGQEIACPSDKIPLANLPTGDRKESVVRGKDAHGPRGHPAQLSPRALQGRPAHSRRRVHRHDSDARRKMDSLERTEALGESRRQLRAIVRRLLMLSLLRAPWSIVAVHLVEAEAQGRFQRQEVIEIGIDRQGDRLPRRPHRRHQVAIAGKHDPRNRAESVELGSHRIELGWAPVGGEIAGDNDQVRAAAQRRANQGVEAGTQFRAAVEVKVGQVSDPNGQRRPRRLAGSLRWAASAPPPSSRSPTTRSRAA